MANPPPPVSSLQEQQLRFVAAQHLMAVPRVPHRGPKDRSGSHVAQPVPVAAAASRKRSRRQIHATEKVADAIRALPLNESQRAQAGRQEPRKSAYVLQKEQRYELEEQARELEEQVERWRLQAGLPTKTDRQEINNARGHNAVLDEKIHTNRQYVVQLQSMVTQQLQAPPVNPLSTFIHLPCDQAQRRAIIHGMKDVKLRRAAEFGVERFRHLESNASYLCEERFTTEDDAYHCNRSEMNAFPNFHNARQLYDALLFWMYNMEISVTEMLNQIALREDTDHIEPTIWNHRIVTMSEDVGCAEELNFVGFAQFYNRCDLLNGAPLGVITNDTVDVDDLYPYKPLERTRKDFQVVHLICEVVDPETQRTTVTVKSCCLNAQLAPDFPMEPRAIKKLHEYMSRWAVFMVQYLHDYIVPVGCDAAIRPRYVRLEVSAE